MKPPIRFRSIHKFVRPHIVLILVDQMRADVLETAAVPTPHLDELGKTGVRFRTCITNGPLCRPARWSLMTGQPVHIHGVRSNHPPSYRSDTPSHVRGLQERGGYFTGVIGKTHLHRGRDHLDRHKNVLQMLGFSHIQELPDAQDFQVQSIYSDWLRETTPKGSINKYLRWRDYITQACPINEPPDVPPWSLSTYDHIDSFCARTAATFLAGYKKDQPLYLQVNFPGPHPPFDGTREFRQLLNSTAPRTPICSDNIHPHPIAQRYGRRLVCQSTKQREDLHKAYYAKVSLVDAAIGEVLRTLKDNGFYSQTWVIVISDHGELLGDHGFSGKVLPYSSAIQVPCIIHPPGGTTGWVDEGVIDILDIVATIEALAGVEKTEEAHGAKSLHQRILDGPNGSEAHHKKAVVFGCMDYLALYSSPITVTWDQHRMIALEMFDRSINPEETVNFVDQPDYTEQKSKLIAQLRSLLRNPPSNSHIK